MLEGKATLRQLAKSWVSSYLGNIIGCALGVAMFYHSGLLPQLTVGSTALAAYKVAYPLKEVRHRVRGWPGAELSSLAWPGLAAGLERMPWAAQWASRPPMPRPSFPPELRPTGIHGGQPQLHPQPCAYPEPQPQPQPCLRFGEP